MAVKTLGLLKRGVINSLSGSIFNPATPIYAAKLSAEVEVQFRYTRTKLYFLRRPTITNRMDTIARSFLTSLSQNGLLHYRGRRGGRRISRNIAVIQPSVSRRPPVISPPNAQASALYPRQRVLKAILPTPAPSPATLSSPSIHQSQLPRLFVLNASSIVKPHAIEQLSTELHSYCIAIAFISETHLKKTPFVGRFHDRWLHMLSKG